MCLLWHLWTCSIQLFGKGKKKNEANANDIYGSDGAFGQNTNGDVGKLLTRKLKMIKET